MFSGTNLLTSCHSASCLFSTVFGSRKASKEIFSELDGTNVKVNNFPWGTRSLEGRRRGVPGQPHPLGAGGPCLAPRQGVGPMTTASASPFAYKNPPIQKPQVPHQYFTKPSVTATTVVPRSGGSGVLPGTLPEGG